MIYSLDSKTTNKKIFFSITVLLGIIVVFDLSDIDVWVQDLFYQFNVRRWVVDRHEVIWRVLFYSGIRVVFLIFASITALTLILFRNNTYVRRYRKSLLVVCASIILVPLIVAVVKTLSNIPCPKNISHYNGGYPYTSILHRLSLPRINAPHFECFPAGHASGGFSLLSLVFLFKGKGSRKLLVFLVMTLSWSIGIYKMLIGDHFLSHTLVSMVLAWIVILLLMKVVMRGDDERNMNSP